MNKSWIRSIQARCRVVGALLLAAAMPVAAADSTTSDNWQFGAEIYLWGASIGGKTASGGDFDIDFDDIFKNLKMVFMGLVGARKGKWSLMTDVIYLDLSDDGQVASGVNASVGLNAWVVTPVVGYNLIEQDKLRLDILAGARYLYLKTELGLGPARADDSGSNWDGVAGVRGKLRLAKNWYVPYYLDVGTGNSKLTWQAFGGIGYRFEKVDVVAAYRYLDWDFDDDNILDDMSIGGPFIGVKFPF